MAIRVLLPQPILPAGYEYLREHGYEVVDGRGFTEDDIVADIADCDAIIVRTAKITKRIFDAAPKLKILARHGAGYDGVDLAAAREHGVLVCTAGGANAISVAELTIFYMLYCSRNFKKVQKLYLEDYRQAKMGVPKTELEGKIEGVKNYKVSVKESGNGKGLDSGRNRRGCFRTAARRLHYQSGRQQDYNCGT